MKPHHSEKCPMCQGVLMVDMIDKIDGVRRVGCELCDEWSDNALSNHGAVMNLRLKMGLNPAPDEEYTPDADDIDDMDEFMAGCEDEDG